MEAWFGSRPVVVIIFGDSKLKLLKKWKCLDSNQSLDIFVIELKWHKFGKIIVRIEARACQSDRLKFLTSFFKVYVQETVFEKKNQKCLD